jgi:hypothetical protein
MFETKPPTMSSSPMPTGKPSPEDLEKMWHALLATKNFSGFPGVECVGALSWLRKYHQEIPPTYGNTTNFRKYIPQ